MNRNRLPGKRASATYSLAIESPESPQPLKVHVTLGRYPDGRLGEVVVNLGKTGGVMRASLEAWAQLASLALQHGVAAGDLANSLRGIQAVGGTLRSGIEELNGLAVSSPWDAVAALIESEGT